MREFLKTAPADLTDPEWIYGAADEALFDVIRAGRAARDMPAFEGSLTDERIRQVIHYVRYLGGKRP
jgi:mono/diheme cytochrome c family protein